jgi:hypothetical protein
VTRSSTASPSLRTRERTELSTRATKRRHTVETSSVRALEALDETNSSGILIGRSAAAMPSRESRANRLIPWRNAMIGVRIPGIETRFASSFAKKTAHDDDAIDTSYDDSDVVDGDDSIDPSWDDDVDVTRDDDSDVVAEDELVDTSSSE